MSCEKNDEVFLKAALSLQFGIIPASGGNIDNAVVYLYQEKEKRKEKYTKRCHYFARPP